MDNRSRPYDSPYERQRMPPPPPPMHSSDAYSMRNPPLEPYHRRGSSMSSRDPYGRGAPTRYVLLRT